MISTAGINKNLKKILFTGIIVFLSLNSTAQITSGKIVFERKTNLKKRLGDNPRMKNFITEENKYRIEDFEMYFNDSTCVFLPLPDEEPSEGMMKYFTTHILMPLPNTLMIVKSKI